MVYITHLVLQGSITQEVWVAILWIIVLLTMIVSVGRSFLQEQDRSYYYYFLTTPNLILSGKIVYATIFGMFLTLLCFLNMLFFFPSLIEFSFLFFLNLFLGSLGLGVSFTMVSGLSAHSSHQSGMVTVLGLPLSIPTFLVAVYNSKMIVSGAGYDDIKEMMITLVSIDIVIIAILYLLFPFIWKK